VSRILRRGKPLPNAHADGYLDNQSELIGNDHAQDVLQLFKVLTETSFGSLSLASPLHQHIQHVAVLIHYSAQGVLLVPDREHDLVHVES